MKDSNPTDHVLALAIVAKLVPFLNDQIAEDRMRPNPFFGVNSPDVLGLLNQFCDGIVDGSVSYGTCDNPRIEAVLEDEGDGAIVGVRISDACNREMRELVEQVKRHADHG